MEVESSFLFELRMDIKIGFSSIALHRYKACCCACLGSASTMPAPPLSAQEWVPQDTFAFLSCGQETLVQLWKHLPMESHFWGFGRVRLGVAVSFAALIWGAGCCVCFMPLHRVASSGMRLSGGTFPSQLLIVAPIIIKTIPLSTPWPLKKLLYRAKGTQWSLKYIGYPV